MEPLRSQIVAWDIHAGPSVVPRTQHSALIHHHWGTKDMPPDFVATRTPESAQNHVTLDFIKDGAVLFHRTKSDGLIRLLRQRLGSTVRAIEPEAKDTRKPRGRPPKKATLDSPEAAASSPASLATEAT
jgi:hypothetical protein